MTDTPEGPNRTRDQPPVTPVADGRSAPRSSAAPSESPALEKENALFLSYLNALRDRAASKMTLTLQGERATTSDQQADRASSAKTSLWDPERPIRFRTQEVRELQSSPPSKR